MSKLSIKMKTLKKIPVKFIFTKGNEPLPPFEKMEEGIIYVSIEYGCSQRQRLPSVAICGLQIFKLSTNSKLVQQLKNRTMSPLFVRHVLPAVFSFFL